MEGLTKRLFPRWEGHGEQQRDGWEITQIIGPLLDQKAIEVFTAHVKVLAVEPLTYIVAAVWGPHGMDELTPVQLEIHGKVMVALAEIRRVLKIEQLNESHQYAIEFLVRNLLAAKILFAVECFKNQLMMQSALRNQHPHPAVDPDSSGKLH